MHLHVVDFAFSHFRVVNFSHLLRTAFIRPLRPPPASVTVVGSCIPKSVIYDLKSAYLKSLNELGLRKKRYTLCHGIVRQRLGLGLKAEIFDIGLGLVVCVYLVALETRSCIAAVGKKRRRISISAERLLAK